MKKTIFVMKMNLFGDELRTVKNRHTSALADVQAKLQNETHKETIRHRLWLELGRYVIVFDPLTFVLD